MMKIWEGSSKFPESMFKNFLKESIKVIAILAVAIPAVAFLAGWQGPKGAPPTENALPPVNVGPDDQAKEGGLSVGTFVSRLQTILARDSGNVGIGLSDSPTEKLDVEGFVKGKAGLCIGDDCRMAWPPVSESGIPAGYQEIYHNVGEDIYGDWRGGSEADTCNGAGQANYECNPEESRTCVDNNLSCTRSSCSGPGHRTITCKTSKILAQGEGLKKSTIGTATITARDYSGSSEKCYVKIQSSACNWEGQSSKNFKWNDEMCEMWVEGNAARICFASKGLYAIWNRSGDSGPIEIFYRP